MTPNTESITGLRLREQRTLTADISGKPDMQWNYRENRLRPDLIVVVMERVGRSPWLVTAVEVHGGRVLTNGNTSANLKLRGANTWRAAWEAEPDRERRRRSAEEWSAIPAWAMDFALRWCAEFNAAEVSDTGLSLLYGIADVEAGRAQRLDPEEESSS